MYGSELEDDEDEVEEELRAEASPHQVESPRETTSTISGESDRSKTTSQRIPEPDRAINPTESAARSATAGDEGRELVPKAKKDEASKQLN
jgi:mitochondrial intermembrane space import and assembly protein 40